MVAQQLHRENIERVVKEALLTSGVSIPDLTAVATTVKPGLALSLGVGLQYSLGLVNKYQKPFIPIHHMEAHALTVRLTCRLEFPFLVLLLSGGHCLLAVAQGVSDFLLLGQSIDIAPGDMLDKVVLIYVSKSSFFFFIAFTLEYSSIVISACIGKQCSISFALPFFWIFFFVFWNAIHLIHNKLLKIYIQHQL